MSLPFNLIVATLDVAGLFLLSRSPTLFRCVMVLAGVGIGAIVTALMLRFGHFGILRLGAYAVFLHGTVLLGGAAVLLWKTRRRWAVAAAFVAATLPAVAFDAFLIEPTAWEVNYLQFTSPKLKRRVRVVVVADLQTDLITDYEREIIYRVRAEDPDIVLFAGDYLQVPGAGRQDALRQLNALLRQADLAGKARVFAVRGNIDGPHWAEMFDGLNYTIAERTKSFPLDELDLTCLALWDSYNPAMRVARPDKDRFHLVLGHVPDYALGRIDADLLVAGHTHGGQFRLPLIGAVITHSVLPRAWVSGVTELPSGARLLVSRGIGMEREYAPRMRFLCRPELVVIDLVPEGE